MGDVHDDDEDDDLPRLALGSAIIPQQDLDDMLQAYLRDEAPYACDVLVVEDDQDVRDAIADVLRGAGYTVQEAADGTAALAAMRAGRPHLLMLDLMMSGVDGWQVVHQMQRDAKLAAIPVCVLSAVADHAPPAACVLPKPVRHEVLIETAERFCGPRNAPPAPRGPGRLRLAG